MAMITDPARFFDDGCGRCARFGTPDCSALIWRDGIAQLRRICLEMRLVETAKWGHPAYVHHGRNIAILGAFRGDFRISFMNAGLLEDAPDSLEPTGPNSQQASVIRFDHTRTVDAFEADIRRCLTRLMYCAENDIRPMKSQREVDLPDDLVDALDADPELAEAFAALTPGRQRSYVIALASAKTAATRLSRIAKFRPRIMNGKGATEL